jgi:uncharacterized Zn finger protein (UPF0148 family)
MSEQQHHEGHQPYTGPITQARGGGCPYCGQNEGYMNIGRSHWDSCSKHKTKWLIGENLFSSWRDESPPVWKQNAQKLEGYKEVRPIYAAPDQELIDPRSPEQKAADELFFSSLRYEPYDGPDILGQGCPKCGKADSYRFDGRFYWATCDKHRTKWRVNEGDVFGWDEHTRRLEEKRTSAPTASQKKAWDRSARVLEGFLEVRPVYSSSPSED